MRRIFPHRPVHRGGATLAAVALLLTGLTACVPGDDEQAGPHLDLDAPIPDTVPEDATLRIGDPATQTALELSGMIDELTFKPEWANISGGPQTLEAFRADALDVGAVADIPPLFAQWTGTDIKIVAARFSDDPIDHPIYELGIAPGVNVKSLDDLRGKQIAYSPGQAQGALVLRVLEKAGLTQDDVELVEMASVEDVYVDALGSKQVEVAPLGQTLIKTYLAKYEQDGATTIAHGLRDDPWHLYVPTETVEDADKAAALKEYVKFWAKAQIWIQEHPDEWVEGYYVDHEGLAPEDGEFIVEATGTWDIPKDWRLRDGASPADSQPPRGEAGPSPPRREGHLRHEVRERRC